MIATDLGGVKTDDPLNLPVTSVFWKFTFVSPKLLKDRIHNCVRKKTVRWRSPVLNSARLTRLRGQL